MDCEAPTSLLDALDEDALQLVADQLASDACGNKTVPNLIAAAGLRGVSKACRDLYTGISTPYDADVEFHGTWPCAFVGGLAFGGGQATSEEYGYAKSLAGLHLVRDPHTGRCFACTVCGQSTNGRCVVSRVWPLWRLAQLLNGHNAEFPERLSDVEAVAAGETVLVPKRELSPNTHAISARNQLLTASRESLEAPVTINRTDFVSHLCVPVTGTRDWVKFPALVLHIAKDYGHRSFILDPRCPDGPNTFRRPGDDRVHDLSIYLGWYAEGEDVQMGTKWMTSLYCHGRNTAPTRYKGPIRHERLKRMAVLAQRRAESLRKVAERKQLDELFALADKARECQPTRRKRTAPAVRTVLLRPRQSAIRAKKLMATQAEYDALANSDGRLPAHMMTAEARELQRRGYIDDQYAEAGTLAGVEYDSDGEYNTDGECTELTPSEWRAHNYAIAKEKRDQDYEDMLVPSDDDGAM